MLFLLSSRRFFGKYLYIVANSHTKKGVGVFSSGGFSPSAGLSQVASILLHLVACLGELHFPLLPFHADCILGGHGFRS
jgi:hypothetical protein